MAMLWQSVILAILYVGLAHPSPLDDVADFFGLSREPLGAHNASAEAHASSSSETEERPYVPFDPVVVEGDVTSSRKAILSYETSRNSTDTDIWDKPQRTSAFFTEVTADKAGEKIFVEASSHASSSEGTSGTSVPSIQPEEVNYLDKDEAGNRVKQVDTESIVTDTVQSVNVSKASPNVTTTTEHAKTTSKIVLRHKMVSTSLSSNVTASASNDSHKTLSSANTSSETTNQFTVSDRPPIQVEMPLHTSSSMDSKNYMELATEITKVNIRFTISAEDGRQRTKAESYEVENDRSESSRSDEDVVTHFIQGSTVNVTTSSPNITQAKVNRTTSPPPNVRQAKAISTFEDIDFTQTFDFNTVATNAVQVEQVNNDLSSEKPNQNFSSIEELIKETPTLSVTTTDFESLLKSILNVTQKTTSDRDVDKQIYTHPATFPSIISENFSTLNSSEGVTDQSIANVTQEITLPTDVKESDIPETTTAVVERTTIRRRLLRPILKGSRRTKTRTENRTQTTTQSIREYVTEPSTPPIRILSETIAPPVIQIDETSLDYPMDMPNADDIFNGKTTERATISIKTTNTIIISSVVGGCAIVFFAFLMVFCMCKQRSNRRTRY